MAEKIFSLNSDNAPGWLNNARATMTDDGDLRLIPENNEPVSVKDITSKLKEAAERLTASNFKGF